MMAFLSFKRSRMPVAALVGATGLAIVCASASAQDTYRRAPGPAIDWSILATLSESVRLEQNSRLNGDNDGVEAAGTLNLGVSVAGRGKRTSFNLASGLSLGRSTDNTVGNLNRIDPNLSATAVFLGRGYSVNVSTNARTRSTSVSEVEESGITNTGVTRFDVGASVGVSWQASKQDSLSISTSAQIVDFSRSVASLSPSQTFGVSGSWSRQETQNTSFSFSSSFRHFESSGANGQTSRTASAQIGIQHRRTRRHSLSGNAGLNFVSSDPDNGNSSTRVSFVGGGSFAYRNDEVNASLALNQSVQPSSEGDLRTSITLSGNLAYRINNLESFGFGLSYTRRSDLSGGGDVSQFMSLGPTYSLALTRASSLSLGYQLRLRDDAANDLQAGHQVLLTLSHSLVLLQ